MRIAVAGGTGWVGKLVVEQARGQGHEVVVMSRSGGVDLISGAGLDDALRGVDVVIDVANVTTLSRKTSVTFFETETRNLLAAEERAGVRHHVLLSIVGIDRVDSGYYIGKRRQEELALAGPIPVTLLRVTQFHEFAAQMLDKVPGPVKVAPMMLSRPIAASEVATELVRLAEGPAQGRVTELAGPEVLTMASMMRRLARGKLVLTVPAGKALAKGGVLPAGEFRRGKITFEQWAASR
ncbi:3-beta hydroxysteroid dehydrogenase [Acrocarpospora phusangensis]|uniref:3-beta hydroxysteroid dehydrogenase n=1 Tax=Acrocarpospora phusangensis TaxID=1070424 RepID=A0A919UQB4_9ACTN|nr:SDR family oxidoreductase [Acrocarpospora phusangensis]GIH26238.1 3-beta hydroxysteroid dehydrogenase [Acrocarpospora phusangensis]